MAISCPNTEIDRASAIGQLSGHWRAKTHKTALPSRALSANKKEKHEKIVTTLGTGLCSFTSILSSAHRHL